MAHHSSPEQIVPRARYTGYVDAAVQRWALTVDEYLACHKDIRGLADGHVKGLNMGGEVSKHGCGLATDSCVSWVPS